MTYELHLVSVDDLFFAWDFQFFVIVYFMFAYNFLLVHSRGPPRPRPVRDGEEDKENQGGEGGQNQQPRQRRYRRNFNYRRRRPQTGGKPGPETKEAKTGGDPSAEKTSAPEAQQGGAE